MGTTHPAPVTKSNYLEILPPLPSSYLQNPDASICFPDHSHQLNHINYESNVPFDHNEPNVFNSDHSHNHNHSHMPSPINEEHMEPEQYPLRTYIVLLNDQELPIYHNSLIFRRKHPQELIQVNYGHVALTQKEYTKIELYLDYVVISLQQISGLHYSDAMNILYWSLRGFKLLFEQFGCFSVDARMIGFLSTGEVKVWANRKYSKPGPTLCYEMLDEKGMIGRIAEIFTAKIDRATIPIDLVKKDKFEFSPKSFSEAISELEGQVDSIELIPQKILSISTLLNAGRKINENELIDMRDHYVKPLDKVVKFMYNDKASEVAGSQTVRWSYGGQKIMDQNPGTIIKIVPHHHQVVHWQAPIIVNHVPTESLKIQSPDMTKISLSTNANSHLYGSVGQQLGLEVVSSRISEKMSENEGEIEKSSSIVGQNKVQVEINTHNNSEKANQN